VETNATCMCARLVGLPDVTVLAVDDRLGDPIRVHVEQRVDRSRCEECGTAAWVKDRPVVELADLPCFGRSARLVWHKHRWCCPSRSCPVGSWTGQDPRIAAPRLGLSDRAGRWATGQVDRLGRTVNEIAVELGCDWHTVNDAVVAYGTPLVEDPARIGQVTAVGLDEVLFARQGPWRTQAWSTTIADVAGGQLLDIVPGRSATGACRWFDARPPGWCEQIDWAVLDLSCPWRLTFDTVLPWARQVTDPFHLVKLANQRLDEVRRRSRTRPSGTGAASTIRSTGPDGCSPAPMNASTTAAAPSCWVFSMPAIPDTRSAPPGMPRKSSARSTTTTIPTSHSSPLDGPHRRPSRLKSEEPVSLRRRAGTLGTSPPWCWRRRAPPAPVLSPAGRWRAVRCGRGGCSGCDRRRCAGGRRPSRTAGRRPWPARPTGARRRARRRPRRSRWPGG